MNRTLNYGVAVPCVHSDTAFFSAKGAIMWWDGGRRRTFFISGTHGEDRHLPRIVLPNAYARKMRSKIDAFAPNSATADALLTIGGSKNFKPMLDEGFKLFVSFLSLAGSSESALSLFLLFSEKYFFLSLYWAPRKGTFSFFRASSCDTFP